MHHYLMNCSAYAVPRVRLERKRSQRDAGILARPNRLPALFQYVNERFKGIFEGILTANEMSTGEWRRLAQHRHGQREGNPKPEAARL